jgi:hypothetical protein
MFVAAGALLGITAKSIGEGLTSGACPQAKALRKRIVKAYGNVNRHGIQRSTAYAGYRGANLDLYGDGCMTRPGQQT